MRVYTIKMHILGSSNELSIYQEGSNELISNLKSNQQTALAKGDCRFADCTTSQNSDVDVDKSLVPTGSVVLVGHVVSGWISCVRTITPQLTSINQSVKSEFVTWLEQQVN